MDDNRVRRIMEQTGCSYETAARYIDLRDEGYTQYQAGLMSGMRDPDEGDDRG